MAHASSRNQGALAMGMADAKGRAAPTPSVDAIHDRVDYLLDRVHELDRSRRRSQASLTLALATNRRLAVRIREATVANDTLQSEVAAARLEQARSGDEARRLEQRLASIQREAHAHAQQKTMVLKRLAKEAATHQSNEQQLCERAAEAILRANEAADQYAALHPHLRKAASEAEARLEDATARARADSATDNENTGEKCDSARQAGIFAKRISEEISELESRLEFSEYLAGTWKVAVDEGICLAAAHDRAACSEEEVEGETTAKDGNNKTCSTQPAASPP